MFRFDGAFGRFMNLLFDILYVGILWVVFSIPLITAGASSAAAYYTMAKCVRHKTGYVGREFWKAFKDNFRQMLPFTLGFWLAAAVLALDLLYVWQNESALNNSIFVVLIFIAFLLTGLVVYLCPVVSRFRLMGWELIKRSGVLMFKFLPVTILTQAVFLAMCAGIYLMPWSVFILPGVFLFAFSFPMEKILRRLMPPVDEDSEEAQKWYYE